MCRAFTQLVQESQFSVVGIVLVAELAKVWKVLRGGGDKAKPGALENERAWDCQKPVMEAANQFDDEIGEAVPRRLEDDNSMGIIRLESSPNQKVAAIASMTNLVALITASSAADPDAANGTRSESLATTSDRHKKKGKKVKKVRSVISELFRGLE